MIVLQIILALFALCLTPVALLVFTIQSGHPYYKLGAAGFFLFYSLICAVSYGSLIGGLVMFVILYIIHHQVYMHFKNCVGHKNGKRHVLGEVEIKSRHLVFDIIISLWPLYLFQRLPFPVKVRPKSQDFKIDMKDLVSQLLLLGQKTNVEITSDKAIVNLKVV